ncbi:MAG: carbon-nitrogen hydrolase family protein [Campylobacter sp.]|nr:carbon-nitrogen hydrolase family protein [Campylobacter sp.]
MLNLLSVSLKEKSVQARIEELVNFIKKAPENSLILAGELCISGYDFDGFLNPDTAAVFGGNFFGGSNGATGANPAPTAMMGGMIGSFDAMLTERLQESLSPEKFLAFTHLTSLNTSGGLAQISIFNENKTKIYNEFVLLSAGETLYKQAKCKLFKPNFEHEKFNAGDENGIAPFEFKGLKIGVLICFELRFSELWAKLKGCDVILAPAMWGKEREDAYFSLCKALAIANNCYVMASSSLTLEFEGIFLPTGELRKEAKFNKNLITQIKQNLGIL